MYVVYIFPCASVITFKFGGFALSTLPLSTPMVISFFLPYSPPNFISHCSHIEDNVCFKFGGVWGRLLYTCLFVIKPYLYAHNAFGDEAGPFGVS